MSILKEAIGDLDMATHAAIYLQERQAAGKLPLSKRKRIAELATGLQRACLDLRRELGCPECGGILDLAACCYVCEGGQ